MEYLAMKWLHIVSSTILFGTGIGSAFYLLTAALTRNAAVVAHVSRWVVRADWLFTATTAVLQPLSGWWLMRTAGFPHDTGWIVWAWLLYAVAIACWLPVVWLQIKMHHLASRASEDAAPLPAAFWQCFRWWVALGVPALAAFMAIFWLMVAKPS